MRKYRCTLRISQHQIRLLVTDPENGDVLKACLDPRPSHPRALLTLLEGISLWNGHPLSVVLGVDENCRTWPDSTLFGDELWPAESQLVRFELAHRACRQVRLSGIGDFRSLRRLERR
jgi:hypothetical protein